MAPVHVDPAKIREFADADSLLRLAARQSRQDRRKSGSKIHKLGSGLPSITAKGGRRRRPVLGMDRRKYAQELRRQKLLLRRCHRPTAALKSIWEQRSTSTMSRRLIKRRPNDNPMGSPRWKAAKAYGRWGTRPMPAAKDNGSSGRLLIAAIESEAAAGAMLEKAIGPEPLSRSPSAFTT